MARTKKAQAAEHTTPTDGATATQKPQPIDLAELFENESTVVTILDPRDRYAEVKRDTGYRFEIGPLWSPEAQEVAQANRGRLKLVDGQVDPDDPAFVDTVLEQIIAVTKRFWQDPDSPSGIILDGELLTCTPENARKVYTHPKLGWLYADVREAYLDRSYFFGQRPKTA